MIRCENLHFFYDDTAILSNINLSIQSGEFIALIGPSACGKTALLRILTGKKEPTHGTVSKENSTDTPLTFPARPGNMDATIHEYLLNARTASKKLFARFSEEDYYAVDKAKDLFHLKPLENRLLKTVSATVLKRIQSAYLFTAPGNIYCLDQSIDSLDIMSQNLFARAIIWKLGHDTAACILATHNLNFALQYADRIILMRDGTIIMDTLPDAVTGEILSNLFDTEILISKNIYNGRPEAHTFPSY